MNPSKVGPDLQCAREAVADLGGTLGRPMTLLASTDSTNDEAKRGARQGAPHGATWVAEEQTAGRGRQGRTWWSPAGENLLFSVLVREGLALARLPQIALASGLAVHAALARIAPQLAGAKIKWPNDVLLGGKKVAGVLVEAMTSGARIEGVIIGIGINVHTRVFPDEIAQHVTSIAVALGKGHNPPDRATILIGTLAALDSDVPVVAARGLGLVRARLEYADGLRGSRVRRDGGDEGIASGIDDEGRLMVQREDGALVRWAEGEVHLVQ